MIIIKLHFWPVFCEFDVVQKVLELRKSKVNTLGGTVLGRTGYDHQNCMVLKADGMTYEYK